MFKLMTKTFAKWISKQQLPKEALKDALDELQNGKYEASLGSHLYKKRIRFMGKGKRGSARVIICFKKGDRAIFIHGFAKNEKSSLSKRELQAFKEFSKILLGLTSKQMRIAIRNGDFIEV